MQLKLILYKQISMYVSKHKTFVYIYAPSAQRLRRWFNIV